MTAFQTPPSAPATLETGLLAAVVDAQRLAAHEATRVRGERRERDFGIGYGSSSGYASARRYAANWGNARFHCG